MSSNYARYNGIGGGGGGGGTLTVGTIDGKTPSSDGAVIDSSTLYMQSASATKPGLVNQTTQTMGAGTKTFDNVNTTGVYQSAGATLLANPGTGNLFLGINAGAGNTASFNIGIGLNALDASPSGGLNTCIGVNAGNAIAAGTQNTVMGTNAGSTIDSGSNNVCIGYASNVASGAGNSFALGANSLAGASNMCSLGSTAVSVGIASVNSGVATARLHIPAGAASAGKAPLKIDPGTNLTSPESGAIENDGTNLYYTDSTPNRNQILVNSTDTLESWGIPANGLFFDSTQPPTGYLFGSTDRTDGVRPTDIGFVAGSAASGGNADGADAYINSGSGGTGSGNAGSIYIYTGTLGSGGGANGGIILNTDSANPISPNANEIKINTIGTLYLTANLIHGNSRIENITDPTSAQDVSTKNYVDTTNNKQTSTPQTITAGGTISSSTGVNALQAAGPLSTSTSTVIASGSADGQTLVVVNVGANTITLKAGGNTDLPSLTDYLLAASGSISFVWIGSTWYTTGASVN